MRNAKYNLHVIRRDLHPNLPLVCNEGARAVPLQRTKKALATPNKEPKSPK